LPVSGSPATYALLVFAPSVVVHSAYYQSIAEPAKGRIMFTRARADLARCANRRRINTAKYLFEARYTAEGAKGVAREGGSGRCAAVAKMTESLGGKLETFYYAFGDADAYVIVDVPDNVSAAAIALAVNQAGAAAAKTVVLITPEDKDKAGKETVDYPAPGR
jgi:uncharacterized protein with GYD domain